MSEKVRLSDLRRWWNEDSEFDQQRIEDESIRTFDLHARWHGFWTDAQDEHINLTKELSSIKRLLYEYYRRIDQDAETLKLLDKTEPWDYESDYREIQHLVTTDPLVIELVYKIDKSKAKVKYTEECLGFVNKRSYIINAINECRRLDRGL